jgi:hypothetical protein
MTSLDYALLFSLISAGGRAALPLEAAPERVAYLTSGILDSVSAAERDAAYDGFHLYLNERKSACSTDSPTASESQSRNSASVGASPASSGSGSPAGSGPAARPGAIQPSERPMRVPQLAKELGLSEKSVRTMLVHGLPHVRIGRTAYVTRADLQAFIASRKTTRYQAYHPEGVEA